MNLGGEVTIYKIVKKEIMFYGHTQNCVFRASRPLVWTLASLSSILIFLSLLSSTRLVSAEHNFSLRSRGVRGQGELGCDIDLRSKVA